MADYYSLISRAIAALPQPTPDARQGVYERARKALINQLRGIQPPVAEADIAAESRALEEAITRLEIELAAKTPGPPPPAKPTAVEPKAAETPPDAAARPKDAAAAWRSAMAQTAPAQQAELKPREPQRPAAPLPPPASQRPTRRILAVVGVLLALLLVVGGLAYHLRESPEDLAKLKPESSTANNSADAGKFDDRVEGGASTDASSSGRRRASNVPVAQKAELWVASLSEPNKVDRIFNAAVVWRIENVGGGPGEAVGSGIRGDVDIPDAKMKMSIVFRKNTDPTLSASHTINVSFFPAKHSPVGGVKAIGPIQMRRADAQSGEKVVGIPVPITENNFLIGLMKGDRETRNVQLLRSLGVIDLPLQFNDGRAATINMEKGASGDRIFADAIDSWGK